MVLSHLSLLMPRAVTSCTRQWGWAPGALQRFFISSLTHNPASLCAHRHNMSGPRTRFPHFPARGIRCAVSLMCSVFSVLCLWCLWGPGLENTWGKTAALRLGCVCSVWSGFATGVVWVQLVCPRLLRAYWLWESLSHVSWACLISLPKYCRTALHACSNLSVRSLAWDLGKLGLWVGSAALTELHRVEMLGKETKSFTYVSPCPHKIFQVEQMDVSGSFWYWW